jgi:hypothetical protein
MLTDNVISWNVQAVAVANKPSHSVKYNKIVNTGSCYS